MSLKTSSAISNRIVKNILTEDQLPEGVVKLSYSQYSVYKQCPHRWYLQYGLKNFPFNSSIDTVFGTAFHETFQEYLTILFNETVKKSDEYSFNDKLLEYMQNAYKKEKESNNNTHFVTIEELQQYYKDGIDILEWIRKKRKKFFDNKNYELVGIETPLLTPILENNNTFFFKGFLDVVMYDKVNDMFIIEDIKTSKKGWSEKYQRKDELKLSQLLLYKKYFSKQFGIPEEKIIVNFHIVRREINEELEYPEPRMSIFEPAHGKNRVQLAVNSLESFIKECFDVNGQVIDKKYRKEPVKGALSNCKFCPFSDQCDKTNLF